MEVRMRKYLITAALSSAMAVAGFMAAPAAHAEPTALCTGPGGVISQPSTTPGTSGSIAVCTVSASPIKGAVEAGGSANPPSGYIVADGNSTNPGALAGYIGVQGSSGGVQVVGCATGDYSPGAGHVVIPPASVPPAPDSCSVPGSPV
jgi:hypothetical protein